MTREEEDVAVRGLAELAWKLSERFARYRRGTDVEECYADALFGALQAVRSFAPDRNRKLEAWATLKIRGAIRDGMRQRDELTRRQRAVGAREMARLNAVTERNQVRNVEIWETLESTESRKLRRSQERREAVEDALWGLDEQQCDVLRSQYLYGETYAVIGERWGVCASRASQIAAEAMERIRERRESLCLNT